MPAYNPVNRRDSYATDFESVHFKSKQTTGPEFYDRSNFSRKISLVGVGIAAIFGWFCIFEGFMIFISKNTISSGVVVISLQKSWQKELLSLGLNLVVTACTETIGFVHSIALRSSLASQQQLHFNTNLRLLSAASGWFNPNGTLCNIVMAILLIVSYSSSLLVAFGVEDAQLAICVSEVPLIVMGVALLLQAVIALASARSADILTWSSSPFDITAALVHHAQIIPEPGQCMRSVGDRARGPVTPSRKQPSAWAAHSSIARVVITLWTLVILCIVWGIIIVHLSDHSLADAMKSWTFFPQPQSHVIAYSIPIAGGVYWYWVLYYINMAAIQGPLTLGLHCSELVVNVIRDEKVWRNMTTAEGTSVSSHPLALVFGSTLNVGLLVLKPLLHWMLGLAISLAGTAEQGYLTAIAVSMWPFQIVNYSVALLIFSLSITVITLANLIDEWSPTMWWGHKEKGFPFYHAGTSDCRLPKVDMNALYA
ncbi:hypothetical protein EV363DRAFT_1393583 [Boletus edulis]|nr:hypothetical protein EV363DRAFT_1393583 [Boletus edulis]